MSAMQLPSRDTSDSGRSHMFDIELTPRASTPTVGSELPTGSRLQVQPRRAGVCRKSIQHRSCDEGLWQDIEGLATRNDEFRKVLYTAMSCQLVLMALKPQEEIGAEVHQLDQFFRVEEGSGEAVLDGVRTSIHAGFAVLAPAGSETQYRQHGEQTPEALHAVRATESSRRRRASHPCGRRGRYRTRRRQDVGVVCRAIAICGARHVD